jgi:lysophospholipase L1-like esterase
MPERYLRTIANQDGSSWDFARYTPGAVVVHLGTNDFAQGDPGQPFVDAYLTFVTGVRGRYPDARLYLTVSPMLGGDKRTKITEYLNTVKSTRAQQGDQNIAILTFAQPAAADGWGCGHPNAATHQIMADLLTQTLKTDLGW